MMPAGEQQQTPPRLPSSSSSSSNHPRFLDLRHFRPPTIPPALPYPGALYSPRSEKPHLAQDALESSSEEAAFFSSSSTGSKIDDVGDWQEKNRLSDREMAMLSFELPSYPPHQSERESDDLPLLATSGSEPKQFKVERGSDSDGANVGGAVFNLATSIIGAGIMALPATMKVLGLPLGLITIFVMALVSEASIEMLVYFSTQLKAWTYGETVQGVCGSIGRTLAELCIIINNSGILIVYLIIIGDVMSGSSDHKGLFEQWVGRAGWWSKRKLILFLFMIIFLAPLASLKKIDSLRFSSALSIALAIVFVLLSSGIALVKLTSGDLTWPRMLPDMGSKRGILDLLVVIPIMTNAFICHFNVQPIYRELQERTPAKMNKVGRISTVLCVVVYAMTAVSGYLLFGDSTASDVLSNFDKDLGVRYSSIINGVIRVGYVIHLILVFPVIHFSLRQTVDTFLFPLARPLESSNTRFVLLNFLLLFFSYLGSALIPNIWIAFQFTGATTGLSLGFIFPALVALKWTGEGWKVSKGLMMLSWAMLIMAVVVSIIGVVGNIINLASPGKS